MRNTDSHHDTFSTKCGARAELARPRFVTFLLSAFAVVGLTLAAVGVFGMMSLVVVQRIRALGIRMALGANPARVYLLVLSQGIGLVLTGIGLGLVLSVWTAQAIQSLLFGVQPGDIPTVLASVALVLATAVIACIVPVSRVIRAGPVEALGAT